MSKEKEVKESGNPSKVQELTGIIYQAISGFYYVWSDSQSYATKPKGLFRHHNTKPLVGDYVKFEIDLQEDRSVGRLMEILPRQNELRRPTVANVDFALVVTALVEPNFSYNLLDYFLVSVESYRIKPIIVLTKYDLLIEQKGEEAAKQQIQEIEELYRKIGYQVILLDQSPERLEHLKNVIGEGIYVVMGQSGVGKSTLLNQLIPSAAINTAAISDSLNRGKHTTREVTLYRYHDGLLADTPGFSAIEFDSLEVADVSACFPEIFQKSIDCKFRSCLHLEEPSCAVKEAVETGEIAGTRYQNYLQILKRIENRKPKY